MKNFMKSFIFGVFCICSAYSSPSIWDGSADISWYEPSAQAYNLINAEQLAGLAKLVNEGTSDFEGKTITLGADIFLNDTTGAAASTWYNVSHRSWTPIGTTSRPFKGEFDGIAGKKNRKIYGLYINSSSKSYAGLFGYTSNVKISNLDVLVGKIVAKDNVGSLVGYAEGGTVTNVHAEARVNGNNRVGGLVGYFTGNISKSSEKGNIWGRDSIGGLVGYIAGNILNGSYFVGVVEGNMYVGGLAGYEYTYVIEKSYVDGYVRGKSSYVGGVAGYTCGNIQDSYHKNGDVRGIDYIGGIVGYAKGYIGTSYHDNGYIIGRNYVGGIAGYAMNRVYDTYSKGNVIGENNYIGGLIGFIEKEVPSSSLYNWGDTLVARSYFVGNVQGRDYVGGLIGLDSAYKNLSAKEVVPRYIVNVYSEGLIEGRNFVGGLVGKNTYSDFDVDLNSLILSRYSLSIDSSFHVGESVIGLDYVGGLVGGTYASITNSFLKGNVSARTYVGGLIGRGNGGSLVGREYDGFQIFKSYVNGSIKGDSSYVGGIVGRVIGYKIDSCFHTSGTILGLDYVGGLAGTFTDSILNSYSEGDVEGRKYVGGLVGASSRILSSSAKGNVKGSSDYVGGIAGHATEMHFVYAEGVVEGVAYVGGLAGFLGKSVMNSWSKGNVSGGGSYVGGLVGQMGGSISTFYAESPNMNFVQNSFSIGNIKGVNFVGGLIGYDSVFKSLNLKKSNASSLQIVRNVKKSYSKGRVEGSRYVGGLIGSIARFCDSSVYLTDAYIYAKIDSSYHIDGDVVGETDVGGLIGSTYGLIANSYSVGDVYGKSTIGGLVGHGDEIIESYAKGNIYASSTLVGGLVGWADGLIEKSYHTDGIVEGSSDVGGLVGFTRGSVSESYSEGDVKGNQSYIGGLVGRVYHNANTLESVDSSWIKNSFAVGDVSGRFYVGGLLGLDSIFKSLNKGRSNVSSKKMTRLVFNSYSRGDVSGDRYIGGLIGKQVRFSDSSTYLTDSYIQAKIDSCFHLGNVLSTNSNAGGIVSLTYGKILNSHSDGIIKGLDSIGGIAGFVGSKVQNAYVNGSVYGRNMVGGIIGYAGDSLEKLYFEGDSVTGIYQVGGLAGYAKSTVDGSYSTANVKGDDNVGGLIGSAYGNISNSYATGNVIGDVEHSSAGNDNLGGLVGYQYSGSVNKSFALGDIYGTTKLGGLVGRFEGTKITQSYANGNVTGDYYGDPVDEVGNYYIGGLVGYAKGSIDESYASGIVKGIDDEPVYTGCLVGFVNGSLSVTKSYYDKTKCHLGIDGGENSVSLTGIPEKTTEEMQTQSTFENWDFTDTWMVMENTYPFLQFYVNSLLNAVVLTESLEGFEYDGLPKTPQVTKVFLFGGALTENIDYTVKYEKNVNAGTAKISVCGLNLYGGCKNIEFEIAPKAVEPTVSSIVDVVYTGFAMTPEISVYNGKNLLSFTDYAVEYKDNINSGTATVSVTMKGNYSGSAVKTFKINKADPVIIQNPSASDVTIGESLALSNLTNGAANVSGNFAWKSPKTMPSLDNSCYTVVFTPSDETNYNTVEIVVPVKVWDIAYVAVHIEKETFDSVVVIKGENYTLPVIPDSVGYDFIGFYKGSLLIGFSGDEISVNENTVIDAKYSVKIFAVNFVNGTIELQSDNLPYGSLPKFTGNTPVKTSSAKYTYTFRGWNPTIEIVSKPVTYTAVFDSVVNKYVITFMDGGTELQSGEVAYGVVPLAPVVTLPKNTAQYTYSFGGWDKEIVAVTEAATYTAVVNRVLNKYSVEFRDYNGSILKAPVEYDYGTLAMYILRPTNPIRGNTAKYTYSFKGWNPAISEVTENVKYVAEYDSTLRNYTITFINGSEVLQSNDIDYGVTPAYKGDIPTKAATAQYTYTFRDWTPAIASVTRATTYTAVFDSVVNKYVIIFVDGETELQSSEVSYGVVPTAPMVTLPKNTAQYTYSFGGWDKEIVAVTEAATYTAVINRDLNKYSVEFRDYDGFVLKESVKYDYGTLAKNIVKPTSPIRGNTTQYTYSFKGWNPAISEVTEDVEYVAEYDSTLRSYTITFKNGSEELQISDLEYGTMPAYNGNLPQKIATAQYAYTFKDWCPTISSVTGIATYTAVFDSTLRNYTITFKNGTTTLQTDDVAYGVKPIYAGNTPTKSASDKYMFTFKEWSPSIETVIGTATYTAVFDSTFREYTVTFKNGMTTLQTSEVVYGTKPSYTGTTPTKLSTDKYSYTFKGWNPAIESVTGAATYTAVFDSTLRGYDITFKNGTKTLQTNNVVYGAKPTYTGVTPTKASTDKYAYTFKGWSPTITSVTGAATYIAVFDSTIRRYAVTFKNSTTTLQTSDVAYDSVPVYKGRTPTKTSSDKYSYIFKNWNPTIASVTSEATYTAVFDSTLREYAVTFKNGTTTLQTSDVAYGTKPSYTGTTPTKASAGYYYTFKGWNPTITSVTGAATYIAVFDSTLRDYAVTFKVGTKTLQKKYVDYGTKPSYIGDTPTKASTEKYTYTFKGWNPSIVTVTDSATYTAVFDSTLRKYTITFKNCSITLQKSEVAYGSKPSYTGSTPTKKATSKYTYKFKGWNPAIATVTKAATYQAVFDSTKVTGIIENRLASLDVTVRAVSRSIQISAASKNSTYAVLDMQGRVLLRGRVESSNFNIAVPRAGCYLVRVGNATRKVQVK